MATVFSLMVDIAANVNKLESALGKATAKIRDFVSGVGSMLANIGKWVAGSITAATAAITYFLVSTANRIDELQDMADRFQMPIAELQKLRFQANMAGMDVESLGTSMQFMLRNVDEALTGTGEAADVLKRLGLDAQFLSSMAPQKQFQAIGEAMMRVSSQGERIRLAMTLFGRSGSRVLNIFQDDLRKTGKEFDELDIALTDNQSKAVKSFNDTREKFASLWTAFKEQVVAAVAPAFGRVLEFILEVIKQMGGIRQAAALAGKAIIEVMMTVANGVIRLADTFSRLVTIIDKAVLKYLKFKMLFMSENEIDMTDFSNLDPTKPGYDPGNAFIKENSDFVKTKEMIEELEKGIKADETLKKLEKDGVKPSPLWKQLLDQITSIMGEESQKLGAGSLGDNFTDFTNMTASEKQFAQTKARQEAIANEARATIAKFEALARGRTPGRSGGISQIGWGDIDFASNSSAVMGSRSQMAWGDVDFSKAPPVNVVSHIIVGLDQNTNLTARVIENPLFQIGVANTVTGASKQANASRNLSFMLY